MKLLEELQTYLIEKNFSQLFLLVDENTSKYCMPILLEKVDEISNRGATLLEVKPMEENKTIQTAEDIIQSLLESNADRDSCMICLGGGMITDLGGFVCSIYKRGIQNINIPTTLLSMVDAAIGGKTAVNFGGVKNAVGCFNFNSEVFVDTEFLSTLTIDQIKDGIAEIVKTLLVSDTCFDIDKDLNLLNDFIQTQDLKIIHPFIDKCIENKLSIVQKDPFDNGERKKLNFGHTLGHAVEMFYNLSHGHSVAVGMYYALDLSVKHACLEKEKANRIQDFIKQNFPLPDYQKDMPQLLRLMQQDKKNKQGNIHFVLLEDIGKAIY